MIRVNGLKALSYFALVVAAAGLAGCDSNVSPAASEPPPSFDASQSAAPSGPPLPPGAPCTAEIDKWQTLISRDSRVGMVDQSVHDEVEGEITTAEQACAAGHDAAARRLVKASRTRHGYPPG